MYLKNISTTGLLIILFAITGYSQQSILSSSADASGTGGTMSYSVGQVVYQFHTGTNGSVAEGVQQPYEIQGLDGIDEGINLECVLFPNPANAFIKLKINKPGNRILSFQLLNLEGLMLRNEKIEDPETKIPMDNLSPSTYFIKVFDKEKLVKTFKVIKR